MRSPGVLEVVRERLRCAHGAPRRRRMHRAGSPIVQKSRRGARQARIPPISPPPVPRPAPCAPPPLRLPRVPDRRLALPEVPPVVLACESSALAGAAGGDRGPGIGDVRLRCRRHGPGDRGRPAAGAGCTPSGSRGAAGGRRVPADHRDAAVVRCPDVRAFVVPVGIARFPGAFPGRRSDNAGGSGSRCRAAASGSVLSHRRLPNGEGVPLLGATTAR